MVGDGEKPLSSGIAHVTVREESSGGGEAMTAFVPRQNAYPELPVGEGQRGY